MSKRHRYFAWPFNHLGDSWEDLRRRLHLYASQVNRHPQWVSNKNADNGIVLVFWVTAEPAVSIIGCCLPMTFHLIRRYNRQGFSSLFTTRKRSTNSNSKQTASSEPRSFGKRYPFQLRDGASSPSKETSSEIELYTREADEEYGVGFKRAGSPDMEMGEKLTHSIIVQKDVDIRSIARE